MKVVCLLASPRPGSHSAAIARRFLDTAAALGADTRAFALNKLTYRGCQACYACKKRLEHCGLRDDLTQVLEAVRESDTLVLATPTFFGDVPGQLKCFIDRTYSFLTPDFETNPQKSRLEPGKKLVFVITQGHPDESVFADVFPRYDRLMKETGFAESHLIRACGVSPDSGATVEKYLAKAEELARALMA